MATLHRLPAVWFIFALALPVLGCCGEATDAKSEKAKLLDAKEKDRRNIPSANVRSREKKRRDIVGMKANSVPSGGQESGGVFTFSAPESEKLAVLEAAVCKGIDKSAGRVPKDPGTRFSLSANPTLALWLSLRNTSGREQTVFLQWKRDGESRTRQDLSIGHSKAWKTWGYKRFRPGDAGRWTVEVQDKGANVLQSIAFEVTE